MFLAKKVGDFNKKGIQTPYKSRDEDSERLLCTLEEFYNKRKESLERDAIVMANAIYERYKRKPTLKEMESFFPLFLPSNSETMKILTGGSINTKLTGDNEESLINDFMKSNSKLQKSESFEAFLSKALR